MLTMTLALVTLAATPQAPEPGRVSHLVGDLLVRGPYDTSNVLVTQNAVIRPGDALKTPYGSFAEVELAPGSFLRLSGGTSVSVDQVDDVLLVVVVKGAVSVKRGAYAEPLSVLALGGRVALEGGTRCRVTLDRDDLRVEVRATDGHADLVTDAASERLSPGETVAYLPGVKERSRWGEERDAFDNWVDTRSQWLSQRQPRGEATFVGYYDLQDNGSWITVAGQSAWRPQVDKRWRPYLNGSWSWTEPYGWVWVPLSTWEYITHHYGHWIYDPIHGWVWVPGGEWLPANVAWAVVGPYVAWAPIGHHHHAYTDTDFWVFAELSYFWSGGGSSGASCGRTPDRGRIGHHRGHAVDSPNDDLRPPRDDKHWDIASMLARQIKKTAPNLVLKRPRRVAKVAGKPSMANTPRVYARGAAGTAAVELGQASSYDASKKNKKKDDDTEVKVETRVRYSGVRMPARPQREETPVVTIVRRRGSRHRAEASAGSSAPSQSTSASSSSGAASRESPARRPVRPARPARVSQPSRPVPAAPTYAPSTPSHATPPPSNSRPSYSPPTSKPSYTPPSRPSKPSYRARPSSSTSSSRPSRSVRPSSSSSSRSSSSKASSSSSSKRSYASPPKRSSSSSRSSKSRSSGSSRSSRSSKSRDKK